MRSGVTVALLALLVGCGGGGDDGARGAEGGPPTTALTLTGTVTLQPDESISRVGGYYDPSTPNCDGASSLTGRDGRTRTFFGAPASEVLAGTSVSVADDKGQTIGVGTVSQGKWVERPTNTNLTDHFCEMPFVVQATRSAPFYAVQIGNQPVQRFAAGSPLTFTFRGRGTLAF